MKAAKLLSKPKNFAVIQLPERKFPGVVFQGDSLARILQQIKNIKEMIENNNNHRAKEDIELLEDELSQILSFYEKICESKGIKLPYFRLSNTVSQ